MKNFFFALITLQLSLVSFAQTTNISGIINKYQAVTSIIGNTIKLTSSTDFSVGDKVLIIQMQGASINESNSSSFGSISNLNNAGNYEFTTICSIPNATEIVVKGLKRPYSSIGKIQVVNCPSYNNATVTAPLKAMPWNGSIGGILTFECSGDLTLNSEIDVQGTGFRGGAISTSTYSCTWLANISDYYYDMASGKGAQKGEGIAQFINNKTGGRGAQANGGGGSNDHNGGGGGGSNAGNGGLGGERIKPNNFACQCLSPGLGGVTLNYSNNLNKVFLGGGGGAGHEDNANAATPGSNGGGIVIIKAKTLIANDQNINAQGAVISSNSNDGAGGGGAGGSVLLHIETYNGTLNVNTKGSNGGNVSNTPGSTNCNGPGGGGGGGILWVNQASLPANINLVNNGGSFGSTLATALEKCTLNGSNNATAGSAGSSLTGLTFSEVTCNTSITKQNLTICNSDSLFIAKQWRHTPGVFKDTISAACCDSIVETTLTVLAPKQSNESKSICPWDSLVVNGIAYKTSTNGIQQIYQNVGPFGCDSIVTIDLTVESLDVSVINDNSTLTVNTENADYQWIKCPSMSPIVGESSQSFQVTANGNYAAVVYKNGCLDTSICQNIVNVGILDSDFGNKLHIYPNPTKGNFSIDLGAEYQNVNIVITNLEGKTVYSKANHNGQKIELNIDENPGVYLLKIETESKNTIFRLLKE